MFINESITSASQKHILLHLALVIILFSWFTLLSKNNLQPSSSLSYPSLLYSSLLSQMSSSSISSVSILVSLFEFLKLLHKHRSVYGRLTTTQPHWFVPHSDLLQLHVTNSNIPSGADLFLTFHYHH